MRPRPKYKKWNWKTEKESITGSLYSTIAEARSKLDSIHGLMDNIESTYEMPDSLMECVEHCFEIFWKQLNEKNNQLESAIDRLVAT